MSVWSGSVLLVNFSGLTRETVFDRESRVKLFTHIDLNRAQRSLFAVTGELSPVADWIHSIVKDGEKGVRDTRLHPVPGHPGFDVSLSAERGALFCALYHEVELVSTFAVAPKTKHRDRVRDDLMQQPGTMAASTRIEMRTPFIAYTRSPLAMSHISHEWLDNFERAIAAAWCVTGLGMIFSEPESGTQSDSEP